MAVASPEDQSSGSAFGWLLLGLTLLGAGLRAIHLDATIGFDEAVNVRRFIQGGPPSIFALHSGYGSTNNHVLNSLLSYLSVRAFGLEVWALRLPSFLFAVMTIPLVGVLAARLTRDRFAAGIAALLVALSPMLVDYAAACRGYGALLFFALAAVLLLLRGLQGSRTALPFLAIALTGVGWSHMSGLVFVGTCSLLVFWISVRERVLRKRGTSASDSRGALLVLGTTALADLVLIAWYSRGAHILTDVSNRIVYGEFNDPSLAGLQSLSDSGFASWVGLIGKEFFGTGTLGLFLCIPLTLAGLVFLRRRHARASWIITVLIIAPPAALLAGRLMPTPRYLLFVQPFLLIAVACGLRGLGRLVRGSVIFTLLFTAGYCGLFVPTLVRNLSGPGAPLMGVAWNIKGAVDHVQRHAEPGDLVLSFPRQTARGPWHEWAFWQSYRFHEDLQLGDLLAGSGTANATRRVWYITPKKEATEYQLYPPGYEPERVASFHNCRVFVDELPAPSLGAAQSISFELAAEDRGGWSWYDPFGSATLLTDPTVSIRADNSGAVGEVRSPRLPVEAGSGLLLAVEGSTEQGAGLRPFAKLVASFFDASGELVARTTRTAPRWDQLPPEDSAFTIRIEAVIPRNAAFVEIALGLAEGTHAGDTIRFAAPTLRVE